VLVFTQFREMTEPVAAFLGKVFGRPGLVLHGGTAVGKRLSLVEAFQREQGPPFFVLSLKAGGTVEEKIDELIEQKTRLAGDILEGGAETLLTEMSDQELLEAVALNIERASI
jgi:SNF2 family DNA or RNA helicase